MKSNPPSLKAIPFTKLLKVISVIILPKNYLWFFQNSADPSSFSQNSLTLLTHQNSLGISFYVSHFPWLSVFLPKLHGISFFTIISQNLIFSKFNFNFQGVKIPSYSPVMGFLSPKETWQKDWNKYKIPSLRIPSYKPHSEFTQKSPTFSQKSFILSDFPKDRYSFCQKSPISQVPLKGTFCLSRRQKKKDRKKSPSFW